MSYRSGQLQELSESVPRDSAGKTKAAVAVKLRRSAKQSDTVDFFTIF